MEPVLCTFLLCDQVRGEGGKFSIAGIFYRIHTAQFPFIHRCQVVVGWCGKEGYYDFAVKYYDPGKNRALLEVPFYPFVLTADRPYFNAVIRAELPVLTEGTHWFEIIRSGRTIGDFPLIVTGANRTVVKM
ncbi:MAG: hypothetical protein K6T80_03570 [Firmicutes bacterium]|nr:hypothetical protein [Bacillota bacterium]